MWHGLLEFVILHLNDSFIITYHAREFQTPMSLSLVMNLVENAIVSCPAANPAIPYTRFRSLAFPFAVTVGQTVSFTYNSTGLPSRPLWIAFFGAPQPVFVEVVEGQVVIPNGIEGISFVALTNSGTEVTDDRVIAGPAGCDVNAA